MQKFRIGILGSGGIAHTMARTVAGMENATVAAVGSRSLESARRFADEFGIEKAYGSYEQLAQDTTLDLIYIATPHSRHFEDCMLCIENGRNVLCEKAFTANAGQAEKVFEAAKNKGVLVTEAIWTRYMPQRFVLDDILKSGVIGDISSLTADLGYSLMHIERLQKPELAGGALLDLGVYAINFALMAFGSDIKETISCCTKNEYGVDRDNCIIFRYTDGKTAILHSNMAANLDRRGIIYGGKGRIEFENINNCEGINVIMNDGSTRRYDTPKQITGYEYEVLSCMKAIEQGAGECSEMPHAESVKVMKIMDSLREQWGIKYPFE